MYERQLLRELEALKPEIENADRKVNRNANGVPRPSVVPQLEDFSKAPPPPPHDIRPSVPASSNVTTTTPASDSRPKPRLQSPMSPQSPGAGPSTAPPDQPIRNALPVSDEPPLGGRFVDGSKSLFIKPSSSYHPAPLTASTFTPPTQYSQPPNSAPPTSTQATPISRNTDPLLGTPTGPSATASNGNIQHNLSQSEILDPLAQKKPNTFMSATVRAQPTRPRLDAREAASKLANMF
jgi:hypothetical protein